MKQICGVAGLVTSLPQFSRIDQVTVSPDAAGNPMMRSGVQTTRGPAALHMMACFVITMVSGCANDVPGAKAYWDAKVKEMCKKDGGVRIYEQIVVTPSQADALPRLGGFLAVLPESVAKSDEPAYSRSRQVQLRPNNPSIIRYEKEIVRRADQGVVAHAVRYGRGGGDAFVLDHPSTFSCPTETQIYEGISKVYRIEGAVK